MVDNLCVYLEVVVSCMFSDSPLDCLVSSKKKGEHGTINVRRGNCHGFGGFLETIGVSQGYWWYLYHLLPFPTTNSIWSYSLMPVSIMLLLQWKPNISPLIKAIVYSAVASFIGLRIFEWLGMYHPKHWSNIYSFVIVIVIYLIADFVSKRSSFKKL